MMQFLLPLLMLYAACGLVLSLVEHILSFFGMQFGGNNIFVALHVGIFPLWIPAVFIANKMTGGSTQRKDFWKVVLSGCPPWMKYMTYGFFIYAFVNFAIFTVLSSMHQRVQGASAPSADVIHGFSGHWMAFYSAGLAILTTAYRRGFQNLRRRCPFRHEVGWNYRFCPTCGASVAPAQD
jgi:hypothetical protein